MRTLSLFAACHALSACQSDPDSGNSRNRSQARWTQEKAWDWYRKAGVIKGCNYPPRTAVNMIEVSQEDTFDPTTIDEELGWAGRYGYRG